MSIKELNEQIKKYIEENYDDKENLEQVIYFDEKMKRFLTNEKTIPLSTEFGWSIDELMFQLTLDVEYKENKFYLEQVTWKNLVHENTGLLANYPSGHSLTLEELRKEYFEVLVEFLVDELHVYEVKFEE